MINLICVSHTNGTCFPIELKTVKGNIVKVAPRETATTDRDNHFTHCKYPIDNRFKKIRLERIRENN